MTKKFVPPSRAEAASWADAYRRATFAVAAAALRLGEVDKEVAARRILVAPTSMADLETARRLLAALSTPTVSVAKASAEAV